MYGKGLKKGLKRNYIWLQDSCVYPEIPINHILTYHFSEEYAFVSCYLRCDDLASDMCLQGMAVQSLHGDREQCDREEALRDFKNGT